MGGMADIGDEVSPDLDLDKLNLLDLATGLYIVWIEEAKSCVRIGQGRCTVGLERGKRNEARQSTSQSKRH